MADPKMADVTALGVNSPYKDQPASAQDQLMAEYSDLRGILYGRLGLREFAAPAGSTPFEMRQPLLNGGHGRTIPGAIPPIHPPEYLHADTRAMPFMPGGAYAPQTGHAKQFLTADQFAYDLAQARDVAKKVAPDMAAKIAKKIETIGALYGPARLEALDAARRTAK